jgi:hypothetical protein
MTDDGQWLALYVVAAKLGVPVADVEDALRSRGYDLDADARSVDGHREYRSAAVAVALATDPWVDKRAAAALLGCPLSSVKYHVRDRLSDDERRIVPMTGAGKSTQRAEYLRVAVVRVAADRARAAAEQEQARAAAKIEKARAAAEREQARVERERVRAERQREREREKSRARKPPKAKPLTPLEQRCRAIADRIGQHGDAGQRLDDLIGATPCPAGTPGAIEFASGRWVRPRTSGNNRPPDGGPN